MYNSRRSNNNNNNNNGITKGKDNSHSFLNCLTFALQQVVLGERTREESGKRRRRTAWMTWRPPRLSPWWSSSPGPSSSDCCPSGWGAPSEPGTRETGAEKILLQPHMGTTFFAEGVKNFFPCVHRSKMAIGEVMFFAAIAWVKREGREGGRKF